MYDLGSAATIVTICDYRVFDWPSHDHRCYRPRGSDDKTTVCPRDRGMEAHHLVGLAQGQDSTKSSA